MADNKSDKDKSEPKKAPTTVLFFVCNVSGTADAVVKDDKDNYYLIEASSLKDNKVSVSEVSSLRKPMSFVKKIETVVKSADEIEKMLWAIGITDEKSLQVKKQALQGVVIRSSINLQSLISALRS